MNKRRDPLSYASQPKAKKTKTLLRLWKYIWNHKIYVILSLFLTTTANLLALWAPKLSGRAIDAMANGEGKVDFDSVFYNAILMIFCYVVSAVLSYLLSVVMISLSKKIIFSMRKDIFEKLSALPVSFFDKCQAGDIISRMSYDVDTINASLSQDLVSLLTSTITIVGAFINMVLISPWLFLVFTLTIPMSVAFTYYKTKKLHPLYRKRSYALGALNGFSEESVTGQKTIRAYNSEKVFIDRFKKYNTEASDACYNSDYHGSAVGPSINIINNVSISLVSTAGAAMYLFGILSLGDISTFVLYSRKFAGPISEISTIINELQSAIAASERVFNLLDEPVEQVDLPDAEMLSDVRGEVEFKNVCFGYTKDKQILNDLSFVASPGKLIAIVGPTGAGKTTIINLLMRFYDVDSGEIFIDGKCIMNLTRDSLRKAFTMVLQETWLFEGTIADNIAYGHEHFSREEIEEAAKAVGIHEYISSLPSGYDTSISDNGINISKGQKQLITIARAMLTDAKMLILDEATSNVDTKTEKYVQAAMRKLMVGKTCFVIAHRLSTIQNADVILVVNNGEIAESGTHAELLEKDGFYASMYNSQFE